MWSILLVLNEDALLLIEETIYDTIFILKKYISKEMMIDITKNIEEEINREMLWN